MISPETALDVVAPVVKIFPIHNPNQADINVAFDLGVASCAVRSYAAGLLLREQFPNEALYDIQFGFANDHGERSAVADGMRVHLGHSVALFWVPERSPLIIDPHPDGSLEVLPKNSRYDLFTWAPLQEGYEDYLILGGFEDTEVDPDEITQILKRLSSNN